MTRRPLNLTSVAALCYLGTAAFTLLNGLPAIAAALHAVRHLSDSEIGWISAIYLAGLALASAVSPWLIRGLGTHRTIQLSVLTVAAGLGILAAPSWAHLTYIGFVIAGLGAGGANGVVYVMIGEQDQERNLAAFYAFQWVSSLALLYFLPRLVATTHLAGAFLCLAAVNLASLGIVRAIPSRMPATPAAPRQNDNEPASADLLWLNLSGIAAVFACQGSIWTFLEIAPVQRGLPGAPAQAAAVISPIFGLVGSAAVFIIGRRWGQRGPLLVSALVLGASLVAMLSIHPQLYAWGVYLFMLSFSAFSAYQFGIATDRDPSGLTAAWASTASYGGFAFGPALAGVSSTAFGPNAIVWVGICTLVYAAIICAIALRRAHPTCDSASLSSRSSG
jgi:predicted MFS family arabinose efflux permease